MCIRDRTCTYGITTPYDEVADTEWFESIKNGEKDVVYLTPRAYTEKQPSPKMCIRDRLKEKRAESDDTEETVTITANSIEELLSRIDTYNFNTRSDEVQTQSERQVGQNIDFRG